jgi:PAS domain S-box-containing protein
MIWAVALITCLPFCLTLLGVDFGSAEAPLDVEAFAADPEGLVDGMHQALRGGFTHTLIEWSAFCAALFTVLLAFVHYRIKPDRVTPILALALLCSGGMDAFHTLAADRILEGAAPNTDLIPFTWALSRVFHVLIMMTGVAIVLFRRKANADKGPNLRFIAGVGVGFLAISYAVIHVCASSEVLPQTMFPDSMITRPWDVGPLVLYAFAGIFLFRPLYQREPSLFSHALLIGLLPEVATEMHMAFGSVALFDSHFNIAHSLKILAYGVPLGGLCLDYIRTYKGEQEAKEALRAIQARKTAILESALDSVITMDLDGRIIEINAAAEAAFGYSSEEATGQDWIDVVFAPSEQDQAQSWLDGTETAGRFALGRRVEVLARRRDQTTFPAELAVVKVRLESAQLFTAYVRDLTEQKIAERAKSQFVSTVSHELRTPLTSISGSLGLVDGGIAGEIPDKAKSLIRIALKNSKRLVRLINDILDIERLAAGSVPLSLRDFDLRDLVSKSLEVNRGYATTHGVTFELVGEETADLWAQGDSDRVEQVMANLLSNAAKWSPKDSVVRVSVERSEDWVRVAVSDTGPGIPHEFRSRIFSRFAQADSSDQRAKGGTGLGLSISKAIVEQLGGRLSFECEERGTTFEFRLPHVARDSGEPSSPTAPDAPKILVVEDDPDIAGLLEVLLTSAGLRVDRAADAKEAKTRLAQDRYAAMTLDLLLPDQDGISLLCDVRTLPAGHDVPVVVVSATADMTHRGLKAKSLEVVDWLCKPIDTDRLLAALRLAIGGEDRPAILHVEDDGDIRAVVKFIVGESADLHSVETCNDAREALALRDYDLVLLDVGLPDGCGLDLLSQLGSTTPVLVFSAQELSPKASKRVSSALVKSRTSGDELLSSILSLTTRRASVATDAGDTNE